jgi:catechol 2,3-dioxygenase-like lactoylglutathione lyase family enzyme
MPYSRSTRIMIYTPTIEISLNFYQSVLGFKIVEEFEHGVMLDTGSSIIELLKTEDLEKISLYSKVSLSLEVDDVYELWEKLQKSSNIKFVLRHNSWGDTSFAIKSPENSTIIFFTKD